MASINVRNEIHYALKKRKHFNHVHLAETELKHGLGVSLSSIQAIYLYQDPAGEYKRLVRKLPPETRGPAPSAPSQPRDNRKKAPENPPDGFVRSLREKAGRLSETITFGRYKWLVLAVEGDRALIITKDVIKRRAYHGELTSVTWATCALRTWLKDVFYNQFADSEKARIATTPLTNPNNKRYGTAGGADTSDEVFLLSIDEAKRYFPSDGDRAANYGNAWVWWWLRSPGGGGSNAAGVNGVGSVDEDGYSVNRSRGGVRPALYIDLKS
ncbi:MAG: DUF6273 domain-containing protein [Oscillospiraceae bacterium]|nr:DUF6273 domain-containing protein [Oscillospiraceae bacterium]